MAKFNQPLAEEAITRHMARQREPGVVNSMLRPEGESFFSAMMSEQADYLRHGVVSQEDLRQVFSPGEV